MTTPPQPAGPTESPAAYEPPVSPVATDWPGVTAEWWVHGRDAAPLLQAVLRFQLDATVPGVAEGAEATPGQRDVAMRALARFDTIHDQVLDPEVALHLCTSLAPADPLPVEHERLVTFVEDVRIALSLVARGEPVPAVTLTMPVELELTSAMFAAQACDLFPLTSTLELRRRTGEDAAEPILVIEAAPALAPPATGGEAGTEVASPQVAGAPDPSSAGSPASSETSALEPFARELEQAFGGRLKVARDPDDAGVTPRPWALRLGNEGVTLGSAGTAQWFAAPPLAACLLDAEAVVETGSVHFSGVDLDEWAARFLACVDRCLAPALAQAIDARAPTLHAGLVDAKRRLAAAAASRVIPTSDAGGIGDPAAGPAPHDARADARETLRAAMEDSLAGGNAAGAVAQVALPVQRAHPAAGVLQLVGTVVGDAEQGALSATARLPLVSRSDATRGSFASSVGIAIMPPAGMECTHVPATLRFHATAVEHERVTAQAEGATAAMPFVVATTLTGEPDPALTIALGSLDIPLPLRRVPVTPIIVAQRATGPRAPATVAEARRWTRGVTIAAHLTAHDVLRVEMRHAPEPIVSPSSTIPAARGESARASIVRRPEAARALADALAPFMAEEEALIARIDGLAAESPTDAERSAAVQALERVVAVAGDVAARWSELPAVCMTPRVAPPEDAPGELHAYELAPGDADAAGGARRLRVRRWRTGSGWPGWPSIDGWSRDAASPPTGSEQSHEDAWYHRDPTAGAIANDHWVLAFDGLDVLSHPYATLSAQVARNAPGAPAAGAVASLAFLMESERATAPAVVPQRQAGPIAIDDLPGATLAEVLGGLCTALVAGVAGPLALRVTARYSHTLSPPAAGASELRVAIPILLANQLSIGPGECDWRKPASAPAQLAARMAEWFRAARPSVRGARIELEVTVLEPDHPLPLIHFESLERQVPAGDAWWGAAP